MSKWTNDPLEVNTISEISQSLLGALIVQVALKSGDVIEGIQRNMQIGNNASAALQGATWLYYGNFDIETLQGRRFNIDMCEVLSVQNVWADRIDAYRKAGLIK